jgi:hypothetical protein
MVLSLLRQEVDCRGMLLDFIVVIVVDLALQSPKQVQNGGKDTAFILHVQIYFCAFFYYLYKVKFLFFCFYIPIDT